MVGLLQCASVVTGNTMTVIYGPLKDNDQIALIGIILHEKVEYKRYL